MHHLEGSRIELIFSDSGAGSAADDFPDDVPLDNRLRCGDVLTGEDV